MPDECPDENRLLAEALRNSVTDVLEKMFFVRSLELDEAEECAGETVLTAQLSFCGHPSGGLTLRIRAKAARAIAADFLGVQEEDLSDREIGEVICELANMICGSVLSRVESTALFRLGAPRLVDELEARGGGLAAGRAVGVSHGAMSVSLLTETTECLPLAEFAS